MHAATELETPESFAVVVEVDSIAEEAERVLSESAYPDLRRLRCDANEGVVTIRGRLPSFFLKQMAQTIVSRIDGVCRVNNQIKVP
jgi:osmotically-inducible protein OsmY